MQVQSPVNGDPVAVKIVKRGWPQEVWLKRKYKKLIEIDPKKFKDLQDLLHYIPPVHHPFFNELRFKDRQVQQI